MAERVVVTGAGLVTALGGTVEACVTALHEGRVQPPGLVPPLAALSDPPAVFAVTSELDEGDGVDLRRTERLALHAAREALGQARSSSPLPETTGVCLGTTVGCTFDAEGFYRDVRAGRSPEPEPVRRFETVDLAGLLAAAVGAAGPRLVVTTACASGTDAIGIAARWVASGRCEAVVAGGADALARFPYLGFYRLQNCSPERPRPFDRDRRGLNLGEGAAVLVLEPASSALGRGAPVLAEIAGWATASDAHHPTAPHPEGRGLRRAVSLALERAGASPAEVDLVNAHGTGTADNDRVEGRVLADLLGLAVPVVSTKGATGHTLGAAGAVEAVLTIRSLLDGLVPPTAGFATPDPACVVVPTTRTVRREVDLALSTSLAFGGTSSALLLRRWRP